MIPHWIRLLVLSTLFLLMSGCGEKERYAANISLDQFQRVHSTNGNNGLRKDNFTAPMVAENEFIGGDYQLGAGDLLVIKVFESEDLDTEVRVSARGYINIPLLGEVKVKNLTLAKTEEKIEELYRREYIHDPHVSVHIKEHVSKQITIVGAVRKPGTFSFVSQRRLLDVLAMGNGLEENAGSLAFLSRKDHESGSSRNYVIDLDDLVKNGNMSQNHLIAGGDVIYIPQSGRCFVDGAVKNPGSYSLRNNMTITEAISLAGGLASWADDEGIKLIRFMGRGKQRQVVSLSYQDLQAGRGDSLYLRDQDLIFAESSASSKLFSGTGFTLGFMGTGVRFDNPER